MPPATANYRVELTPEQDKQRRISVRQASQLKGISEPTFRRHFAHLIQKTTPGRDTVRLGDVLED